MPQECQPDILKFFVKTSPQPALAYWSMNVTAVFWAASGQPLSLPGIVAAYEQMNALALIGCAILLLMLVAYVGRYLRRGYTLRQAIERDSSFLHGFAGGQHSLSLFQEGSQFAGSPRYAVYEAGSKELAFHLVGTDVPDRNFPTTLRSAGRITPSHMDAVRRSMDQAVTTGGRQFSLGLGGASLHALPAMGAAITLLAWTEDAGAGRTPPLAATLIPLTLATLLFALLMPWHNFLVRRVRTIVAGMQDFAASLAATFDRAYVDHRKPLETLPSLDTMRLADGPNFSLPPSDSGTPRPGPTFPPAPSR